MMGSVAGRIERGGPFCDIKVMASPQHVALLKAAGRPFPAIFTVGALESDFASEGFMALVGWDVLRHCLLICDGPAATFTLYF